MFSQTKKNLKSYAGKASKCQDFFPMSEAYLLEPKHWLAHCAM